MANKVFSDKDNELLDAVAYRLQSSDIGGEIQIIFNEIRCICKEIGLKAAAEDSDRRYVIHLEIDHDTDPKEVRFYINTKLRTKLGQFWNSIRQSRGKTDILVLTKNGYRLATPENLDCHRNGKTSTTTKRLVQYAPQSFDNINTLLTKFREILQPRS